MNHDEFLCHFDAVRADPRNPNNYRARCPAHDDKDPSLSITDLGDKWVLHCWAGCSNGDILAAAGLSWAALFSRTNQTVKAMGPTAAEKLSVITHELRCIDTGLIRLAMGDELDEEIKTRVQDAARFCLGVTRSGR